MISKEKKVKIGWCKIYIAPDLEFETGTILTILSKSIKPKFPYVQIGENNEAFHSEQTLIKLQPVFHSHSVIIHFRTVYVIILFEARNFYTWINKL